MDIPATSDNIPGTLVLRDASGNLSAGTITANLTGTASAIADNAVTSGKIADGTIVNADINASAAIAGTKIAPNFGSQNVVTTGALTSSEAYIEKSLYAPIQTTSGTVVGQFASNANGSVDIRTVSNHSMLFLTNNTERLRIDASGNVGIGTSSPATRLHVDGTIRYTNRPTAGTITAIGFDANGDLRASSSSLRYKHNVEPYAKGLAEVAQLEPVTFKYNGEELVNAGLIVEDLEAKRFEEFVLRDSEGTADAIPYGNMVALLINAIKELKTRVEELEAAQ